MVEGGGKEAAVVLAADEAEADQAQLDPEAENIKYGHFSRHQAIQLYFLQSGLIFGLKIIVYSPIHYLRPLSQVNIFLLLILK